MHAWYLSSSKNGGSVVPANLWKAFDEQVVQDKIKLPKSLTVESIMATWTEYQGYPLITVQLQNSSTEGKIIVRQVCVTHIMGIIYNIYNAYVDFLYQKISKGWSLTPSTNSEFTCSHIMASSNRKRTCRLDPAIARLQKSGLFP